jgi:hypothetical protein
MFNITLHKSKEIFTVAFSISAMTEFINIINFISLYLKDAMCYRIIFATFGIDDLNSIWRTEYYAGRKTQAQIFCAAFT